MRKILVVLALGITLFGCMILLGCEADLIEGIKYEIQHNAFYVQKDGMPCLVYHSFRSTSITCDWSKFKGEDTCGK